MARQTKHRVGKLKSERIPAFTKPAFGYPTTFEHDMLSSDPRQVIAHGEASLTAADDTCLNALGHGAEPC
jgi:hypothetical protein